MAWHHVFWFFHILGLALWFGSMSLLTVMLFSLRKVAADRGSIQMTLRLVKAFNALSHLGAFLMLLTGVLMIIGDRGASMPLWVSFMQNLGGLTILFSLIVLTIVGSRMKKRMVAAHETPAQSVSTVSYRSVLIVTMVLVLIVLAVVSAKIR